MKELWKNFDKFAHKLLIGFKTRQERQDVRTAVLRRRNPAEGKKRFGTEVGSEHRVEGKAAGVNVLCFFYWYGYNKGLLFEEVFCARRTACKT